MKKILFVLIIIFTLTGCYNYKELNDLGIVSAIGISKENDEFILDVQLINIVEAGKNGISESPITVINGKGKTIFEAARSLNSKSPKTFFISNLEYVLLDESILKEDFKEVIDYLTRDTRFPLNFLIVTTTEDKPSDIMSSLSQFDINSASNLSKTLKLSESRFGEGYSLTMIDLLNKYLQDFGTIVFPNIKLVGNIDKLNNTDSLKKSEIKDYVEIEGLVFFKDKERIKLSKEEAFGYNFILNHITNGTLTCKCDGGYFTAEILNSKFGFDEDLKKDKIIINGKTEVEIIYYGCNEEFDKEETTKKLNRIMSEQIKSYISKTIKLAQENKSDFIEIGSFIYKNNNKYFDFKNKNWDEVGFPYLMFNYDIKSNIVKQGNLRGDIND